MENPINNTVFDSRDLIEYREFLEVELIDSYNDYLDRHNQECAEEGEEMEEVDDISDVDFGLEGFVDENKDEIDHYEEIANFCEELENYGDFEYGEAIISENYFEEYCEDFCKDVGYISNDLPGFIKNAIDWEKVADDLKRDYTEADFEGTTYYMRA